MQVLRGGERDGVRLLGAGAGGVPAARLGGAGDAVMVGDLLALALLFSAVGAAAEFGILGERGNSHVRWAKVCNVYGAFCERANDRRHRLPARRLCQPRHAHAHHPRIPQELILLLVGGQGVELQLVSDRFKI